MKRLCVLCIVAVVLCAADAVQAASSTRDQALKALDHPDATTRIEGVERLGVIGRAADADRLMRRLGDADPEVRAAATDAIWQIWSRSGDAAIDKLFARGVEHMQGQMFEEALTVFNQIVARKPAFAEGWNKRATVRFMRKDFAGSIADCQETLARNPNHFGASSGQGLCHMSLGEYREAAVCFRRAQDIHPHLDAVRYNLALAEAEGGGSGYLH